jgi:hypothetical protein
MIMQEKNSANKKDRLNFKFSIKAPAKEINPYDLLNASLKTGIPIVFAGDRISNFEMEKNGEPIDITELFKSEGTKINGIKDIGEISKVKDIKFTGIKIIPGNIIPLNLKVRDTDCSFDNLLFRGEKIRNRLKISTEERNSPYKFEFIDNEKSDSKFKLNIDPSADVKQIFKLETFLKILTKKNTLDLIKPENGKVVLTLSINETIFTGNDAWHEFLKKLIKIQEVTNHKIRLHENFEVTQQDDLNTNLAFKIIDEGSIELPVNNFSFGIKASFLKKLMKKENEKHEILTFEANKDYVLTIFGEKITFGIIKIELKDYDFLYEDEMKLILNDASDEDKIKVTIKPNQKFFMEFKDYSKS